MAIRQHITFSCDNCGKDLPTSKNQMNICTSKSEDLFWRRLHVKIELRSGVNNVANTDNADLCQDCAIVLLTDALKRVKKGERATKGTESMYHEEWCK